MLITNAAVIRMANATPADRDRMLSQANGKYKEIINKAKDLMGKGIVDSEQNNRLDDLIGACSIPRAKQIHGDAMILEQSPETTS